MYADYAPRVRGLVRRYIGGEVVEDLVQEAFVRAYRAGLHRDRAAGRDERATWNWLAAVARNLAIDVLRHHGLGLEQFVEHETLLTITLPTAEGDPHVEFQASARREGIADAFGTLGERQRRILYLKDVEGRCYDEIARFEGVSVDAVKAALSRGRRTFREAYASIAARRGLSVVLGGLVARAQARLRWARERVAAGPAEALANLVAAAPVVGNALFAAVVVGTVVIASAGTSAAGEPEPASHTEAPERGPHADPEPDEPSEPSGPDLPSVDDVVVPLPVVGAPSGDAPEPEPQPEPERGPARHEASGEVDSEEVDPSDQPHARARAQAESRTTADTEDGKASSEQEGETETVLDGLQATSEATNVVEVTCPDSGEETLVTGTTCSTLAEAS